LGKKRSHAPSRSPSGLLSHINILNNFEKLVNNKLLEQQGEGLVAILEYSYRNFYSTTNASGSSPDLVTFRSNNKANNDHKKNFRFSNNGEFPAQSRDQSTDNPYSLRRAQYSSDNMPVVKQQGDRRSSISTRIDSIRREKSGYGTRQDTNNT